MYMLLAFVLSSLAVWAGHHYSRDFVRRRLRFVDAVQGKLVPWIVGAAAALVAWPVAWLLPFVSSTTALIFGVAVGLGVSAGARDVRGHLPSSF